jgi:hypothetical protein
VRVTPKSPPTGSRLGEQHPRLPGQCRIACCLDHEGGQLLDDGDLLVPVERSGVGQDLDPDVPGLPVDVGDRVGRQLADEGRGVLPNIGMSGTDSMRMTVAAAAAASAWTSRNVPAGAVMSIIGTVASSRLC